MLRFTVIAPQGSGFTLIQKTEQTRGLLNHYWLARRGLWKQFFTGRASKGLAGNRVVLILVLRSRLEQHVLQILETTVLREEAASLLGQLIDIGAVTLSEEAASKQPVQMLRHQGMIKVGPIHDPGLPHLRIPYRG